MELRQLEYFVAVAEEANFTRAAARVHISQSGVSAQIRQLERELGATLIDRSGRVATLTAAGEAALEHARSALSAAAAVRQSADEVNELIRGRLAIGMVVACTVAPLFDALAVFHDRYPGVRVATVEDNSDQLIERVRAGTLDLALVGCSTAPPAGLNGVTVISERIVAAVPHGHHLAQRRRLTIAELVQWPLVCLPVGTGIRAVLDEACAERGLNPDVVVQASAPTTVADLAARGLGVAVLSETVAAGVSDRLVAVRLDVDTPAVLALVWATNPSPALRELSRNCRQAFGLARPDQLPARAGSRS
jgi:DNA-binding transcriptional LysR family regulator